MVEPDYVKSMLAAVTFLSLLFNIYQYTRSSSRFSLQIHPGQEPNKDGSGLYLVGILSVSNIGKLPAYFSGVKINQMDGDYYYPIVGIDGGTKIEPGQTVQGSIPVGHLIGNKAKELVVLDGVWKEYKISKRRFRKFLKHLEAEASRLESVGARIHPASSVGV